MTASSNQSSSPLNRTEVKRRLIQCAQDTRYHFQTFDPRVSEQTLLNLEASVEAWIRAHVAGLPSKGKTI